ncbi:COMM domain-containing protein 7-like [Mizuhopecten yessoensis]|uniref:COMM domain-containing protein 7 n=1 Tax=Mizuhopecten yessoensis TaxID=6573 RepID=A0A210QSC4_MIZYE|nr:COMM domain-containing protein 7-like [Mizuhopecten yessoensis]OWF51657.1 COMM domain-containing protein 7 [Mizuhopecten yessoensis]
MASTFHFSKETPPDTVFSDIQMVNKFQNEQFRQLVAYSLEFLADPGKSQKLMEQLGEFAESNGVGASTLKNVFKSLLLVPNSALKKSLSPVQLQEDLVNLGLSKDKANYFSEQWKANLAALSRSALGQTLMVNQLLDMEWKFGVTAGSSEADKVGNTFLQLKLVINTGNGTKNTYMELTLPQFYSFLHEMEKAKASLEYLS